MTRFARNTGLLCSAIVWQACSCGAIESTDSLTLSAPATLASTGATASLRVSAFLADGTSGTGSVALSAPAGTFSAPELALVNGAAAGTWACDVSTDPGCTDTVTVTAKWNGATATRRIRLVGFDDGGEPADSGTELDGGGPDGGGPDGGGPDAGIPDAGILDGGVERDAGPPRSSGCTGSGGTTFPDGGHCPLGCSGEPIDFMLFQPLFGQVATANAVTVCGAVTLSRPISGTASWESQAQGQFDVGNAHFLGGTLNTQYPVRPLVDPTRMQFRFDVEPPGASLKLCVTMSDDVGVLRGCFAGTTANPITDLDSGTVFSFSDAGPNTVIPGLDFGL